MEIGNRKQKIQWYPEINHIYHMTVATPLQVGESISIIPNLPARSWNLALGSPFGVL